MNADGTNQHAVTSPDNPANQGDLFPAWSPDGTKIAFSSRRAGDGGLRLYTINADGSNLTEITHGEGIVDVDASWSPEGSGLAYSSSEGGQTEIWIVNADGSARMRITNNPNFVDSEPSWKP
jgi:TolB protein